MVSGNNNHNLLMCTSLAFSVVCHSAHVFVVTSLTELTKLREKQYGVRQITNLESTQFGFFPASV